MTSKQHFWNRAVRSSGLILAVALAFGISVPGPEKAPDFTLKNRRGETVTLSSLKGRVVVVNFWATFYPGAEIHGR
ncbi:MAG: redoxin domain-containing protein [Bacteroidota bacterium]